jgi:DNA-binding NarL/FixJ family response regulator
VVDAERLLALDGRVVVRDRVQPGQTCQDTGIKLTARELAVLDLMADGLIAAAIARRLGISPRTVNKHIEHVYEKLGTHDRTTTALRAGTLGFLRR